MKEELTQKLSGNWFKCLGVMFIISMVGIFSSPFIWMWYNWDIAWKVGLSSIILFIILRFIYLVSKHLINEVVEENLKNDPPERMTFKERLDQAMEKAKNNEPNRN